MSQRKIPIDQATEPQLRQFALETLGLSIHPQAKEATVLAKVKEAWDKPEITVSEEAPPPAAAQPQPSRATKDDGKKPERKVTVKIFTSEEPGGNDPVPLRVNGIAMLVPRDKEVEIPYRYYECLRHAVADKYDMMPDGQSINPVPRKVQRYPFQVIERDRAA